MKTYQYQATEITLMHGDLLDEEVDAIVCPANSFNQMRGGIAGVIRQRGGEIIEQEAMAQAPVAVGQAVVTTAGKLPARHVIHAPTMKLPVQNATIEGVVLSVRASLSCADQHGYNTIAFPGMGTGIGGVSYADAARAMLAETKRYLGEGQSHLRSVIFVGRSQELYDAFVADAEPLFGKQ